MKNYLFISNSSIPSKEVYESIESITLTNVRKLPIYSARELGYNIYLGVNRKYAGEIKVEEEFPVNLYNQHIFRNVFDFKNNYIAYKNLSNLLKNNKIDVLHCNTPIGGVLGRILGKKYKVDKIIYTAHGFHFYNGAPFVNNFIYKNIEKFLAKYTDVIITMNNEDYESAKKFNLKRGGKVYKISGVGVDTGNFIIDDFDREEYRERNGISKKDILVLSTGDLIKRKNFKTAIEAIFHAKNNNLKLYICGRGPLEEELNNLIKKYKLENNVKLLGFRKDIKELLLSSDIYLFSTFQEGLPRALMEAMSAGLPCVASEIRGNIDIIDKNLGGYLLPPDAPKLFASSLDKLANNKELRISMGDYNLKRIKKYDSISVKEEFREIFEETF